MVQRSELAQLNPQFLSKGLLKRVSIDRSLREEIGNVQTKRNRKKPDERQSQRTKQNNTQQQTKTKSEFLFLGQVFFKLKIKMKNTRYLHLTNEWKRNEQKKKKISFCFTFFAKRAQVAAAGKRIFVTLSRERNGRSKEKKNTKQNIK